MPNYKLSVVIPARNEQFLQKTIESVLAAAVEDIEIIAVCDGYWPDPQVKDHPNVIVLHYTKPIGQRAAINNAMRIATGKYMMKLDAHCNIAEGFDKILKEDCRYEWTMVPRMYVLDILTWKPKLHKRTDYMYISSPTCNKPFRAMYYGNYNGVKTAKPNRSGEIDGTMCCMGPGWFMHSDRFWELGGCDENHGGWGQQGIEVSLKAWLSGGALMVNKKTWFAHWFRGGGVPKGYEKGFPYSIRYSDQESARKYSKDLWLNNKWPKQKRTIEWLVKEFNAPTWDIKEEPELLKVEPMQSEFSAEESETINDFNKLFFKQWNKYPRRWAGTKLVKYPTDLFIYQMIITGNKPDFIIETGTFLGGSALFFASVCDLIGHGHVIGIDKREIRGRAKHPRISYIVGRATGADTLRKVKEIVGDGSCMVVLDSDHRKGHVKRELTKYSKIVTKGQYLVTEDTMLGTDVVKWKYGKEDSPKKAVDWFIGQCNEEFVVDPLENRYMVSMNPGGWLRRIK
jgi:cephalosporin hydroxylase